MLVPAEPGILSAIGMLEAPEIEFGERTVLAPWSPDLLPTLERIFGELETEARTRLGERGRDEARVTVHGELAMRIVGQAHDLAIAWRPGIDDARPAFHEAYRTRFGVDEPDRPVELTARRVRLEVAPDPVVLPAPPPADDGELVELRSGLYELPFGWLEVEFDSAQRVWADRELDRFVPVAELRVRGLRNHYRQRGIGAPLAAELLLDALAARGQPGTWRSTSVWATGRWPPLLHWRRLCAANVGRLVGQAAESAGRRASRRRTSRTGASTMMPCGRGTWT